MLLAALLIIAFLTYGIFITELGLYWDDFPYTWFGHVLGTTSYHKVFYDERPFLAPLYNLTAPIFGENILSWQIFAIVIRWACALCVGWIFRLIWPGKKDAAYIVSLLFLVYPGFGQQWIATIYSRVYILLLLFLVSLGFMIKSLRKPEYLFLFTVLSLSFGALSLLGSEYYFGLEFARPFILWIVLFGVAGTFRERIKRVVSLWLPYLIGVIGFAIWRGVVVQSALYGVQIAGSSGQGIGHTILDLMKNLFVNAYKGGVLAWMQVFDLPPIRQWIQPYNFGMLFLMLAIFCLIVLVGYKFFKSSIDHEFHRNIWHNWQLQAILLGSMMLILGSLPMWAAKLPFDLKFPYNRFMLSMMFGSALFLTGIIYFIKIKLFRVGVIGVLVAFSVGWHFQTANTFRLEWIKANGFLQQLTWRIPNLKPATMLIAYELPFKYYSDNSLTAAINWTYAPEYHGGDLPFVLDYLTVRKNSVLKQLDPGIAITQKYRSLEFKGNTSDVVVLYLSDSGCLRVLDEVYTGKDTIPNLKDPLPQAIALSNLDRIITNSVTVAQPIPQYFDTPNTTTWCYFFEKADLARQVGNWEYVMNLWQELKRLSLSPGDLTEYSPFIEAMGFSGEIEEAGILSNYVNEKKPSLTQRVMSNLG